MRVVLDTNIVVSAFFWKGPSRKILDLVPQKKIQVFTSLPLLAELEDVLYRKRFTVHLQRLGYKPQELVFSFASLAQLVHPSPIPPVILEDPQDDEVLACAMETKAQGIVSGDRHLKALKEYQGIPIFTAPQLLERISE